MDSEQHYITTAEAAVYLRYRTPAGIRAAVARGELKPAGRGPRGCQLFTRDTLVLELNAFQSESIASRLGTASRIEVDELVGRHS